VDVDELILTMLGVVIGYGMLCAVPDLRMRVARVLG